MDLKSQLLIAVALIGMAAQPASSDPSPLLGVALALGFGAVRQMRYWEESRIRWASFIAEVATCGFVAYGVYATLVTYTDVHNPHFISASSMMGGAMGSHLYELVVKRIEEFISRFELRQRTDKSDE